MSVDEYSVEAAIKALQEEFVKYFMFAHLEFVDPTLKSNVQMKLSQAEPRLKQQNKSRPKLTKKAQKKRNKIKKELNPYTAVETIVKDSDGRKLRDAFLTAHKVNMDMATITQICVLRLYNIYLRVIRSEASNDALSDALSDVLQGFDIYYHNPSMFNHFIVYVTNELMKADETVRV